MRQIRVGFVGDSITHGTGDETLLGWTIRLGQAERAKGQDVVVYNLGIRADTSVLAMARWRAECAARLGPAFDTATVFAIGINDSAIDDNVSPRASRVALPRSLATIRAMLEEASAFGPTAWVGPTPVVEAMMPVAPVPGISFTFSNDVIAEYNAAYAAMANEIGVGYLDLFTLLKDDQAFLDSLKASDGLHPSAAGYEIMAAKIGAFQGWRAMIDG